jgi:Uma2 family endonuclease
VTHLGWPHDLMTLAEFEDLAKVRDRHYELQEGIPFVSPLPPAYHDDAVSRLAAMLGPQLPATWRVVPGTRTTDALTKSFEYAGVGIPDYWVIDPQEPVSATVYHLGDDGRYQEGRSVTGAFSVVEPFPLSVDLTELPSPQTRRVDQ